MKRSPSSSGVPSPAPTKNRDKPHAERAKPKQSHSSHSGVGRHGGGACVDVVVLSRIEASSPGGDFQPFMDLSDHDHRDSEGLLRGPHSPMGHTEPGHGAPPESDTSKVDQPERRNPTTGNETPPPNQ